ncbi:mucin-like protein 1 [Coprinopsis cinerea AmutBmut pab1-1]|nr:mucin-like protein 1 [Coprinopsis cinerea AmutBmut pab1-1]
MSDLGEAIRLYREALELRPAPHPDRSSSLINLANALLMRFAQIGTMSNIEQAIQLFREALELTPTSHARRHYALYGLGRSLFSLFRLPASEIDIEEVVDLLQEALALRPTHHPLRGQTLPFLADDALEARFNLKGMAEDREEAVRLRAELAELRKKIEISEVGNNPFRHMHTLLHFFLS